MIDIKQLAQTHGEKIRKNKISDARLMKTFNLTALEAEYLRACVRGGTWLTSYECRHGALPLEAPKEVALSDEEPKSFHTTDKYLYNEATKTFMFSIPNVAKVVTISKTAVDQLLKSYTNMGQGASINACARATGLPRHYVVYILRALGTTHDSLPFTDEEVAAKGVDDLVADALELKKAALHAKIAKTDWAKIQSDADKWNRWELEFTEAVNAAVADHRPVGSITRVDLKPANHKYVAMVTPTDFHWGKHSDDFEVGDPENPEQARAKLLTHTEKVLKDVCLFGAPARFLVGVGGDFFNVDNDQKGTTDGTPQDMAMNPSEMFATGCDLFIEYIEQLRAIAPVELRLMAGNHDRQLSFCLLMYLEAWYRKCEDVYTVRDAKPRQYAHFGKNLIMLHHGDFTRKVNDLAMLAATEAPVAWGKSTHRIAFTGHYHSENVAVGEDYGFIRYQLPSLSTADRWHNRHGYVGNRKTLAAVLIDHEDGVFCTLYS